jgi:hypothetical protein
MAAKAGSINMAKGVSVKEMRHRKSTMIAGENGEMA